MWKGNEDDDEGKKLGWYFVQNMTSWGELMEENFEFLKKSLNHLIKVLIWTCGIDETKNQRMKMELSVEEFYYHVKH